MKLPKELSDQQVFTLFLASVFHAVKMTSLPNSKPEDVAKYAHEHAKALMKEVIHD